MQPVAAAFKVKVPQMLMVSQLAVAHPTMSVEEQKM